MEDQLEENIYLDESAKKLILFTFRQYKVIAALWIALSIVSTAISILSLIVYRNIQPNNWTEIINYKFLPFLYLAIIITNVILLFHYYQANRAQKKAVTDFNQTLFVKSFEYYKTGNYVSICALILNLINSSFILYQNFKYYAAK